MDGLCVKVSEADERAGVKSFTYLSAAELIPELQKEKKLNKSVIQFAIFLVALIFIWGLVSLLPE